MDGTLVAMGSLVGLMIGLTGVGGGSILTPLLVLVGTVPSVAVGTDLAFAGITKAVGILGHIRAGTVHWRALARLAVGSVPGSLVGGGLVSVLVGVHGEIVMAKLLGFALLLAAGATVLRVLGVRATAGLKGLPWLHGVALGFLVGTLVGATSVGAGSVLMAVFALFSLLPTRQMVGTDVAHGALLAAVASTVHWWAGRVDLSMLALLLAGAVPGVLMGSWLCGRIPERPLRFGIALVLVVAGVRLL